MSNLGIGGNNNPYFNVRQYKQQRKDVETREANSQNAPVNNGNETREQKKPTPKPLTNTTVVEKWGYRFIISFTDGKLSGFEVEKIEKDTSKDS